MKITYFEFHSLQIDTLEKEMKTLRYELNRKMQPNESDEDESDDDKEEVPGKRKFATLKFFF